MTINIERSEDVTIIELSGRLDTVTAPALEKIIDNDLEEVQALIFDLNMLEYISSAGLRVLLKAQKKMQKLGGMKLVGVCETVMEVFQMTNFDSFFTIE